MHLQFEPSQHTHDELLDLVPRKVSSGAQRRTAAEGPHAEIALTSAFRILEESIGVELQHVGSPYVLGKMQRPGGCEHLCAWIEGVRVVWSDFDFLVHDAVRGCARGETHRFVPDGMKKWAGVRIVQIGDVDVQVLGGVRVARRGFRTKKRWLDLCKDALSKTWGGQNVYQDLKA